MKGKQYYPKILLVDDRQDNLLAMRELLEDLEVIIFEALSGEAALSLMQMEEFSLVLLDVQMPDMDGFEIASIMQSRKKTRYLPIIFVTGISTDREAIVRGYASGAVDFLSKPIEPCILRKKVGIFLELGRQTRRLKESEERYRDLAEFATGVLHNVGNVLNSISVSSRQINTSLQQSKVGRLTEVSGLLARHRDDPTFLSEHPQGKILPDYLAKLSEALEREHRFNLEEIAGIRQHFQLMSDLIKAQQQQAKQNYRVEFFDVAEAVEDALKVNQGRLEKHEVAVRADYRIEHRLRGHRARFVHVLINLFKNAIEAMVTHRKNGRLLKIDLDMGPDGFSVRLEIEDNGHGVDEEHKARLFLPGFSTKEEGHGFGLPYCARTISEMNGTIEIESEGHGKGTTFVLNFPREELELRAGNNLTPFPRGKSQVGGG